MNDMRRWKVCEPPRMPLTRGAFVELSPLRTGDDGADGHELFSALAGPGNDDLWRYISFGPPESANALMTTLRLLAEKDRWLTLVLRAADSGDVLGMASYMRVRPEAGSAEIGCLVFSKALQRTPAATEALFLVARYLFDELGYRRFEWKCDNANIASKNAARRFGFTAEGVFRQDMIVKGKNRDTAWFSILDREWPRIRSAFEQWLAPENFDASGQQLRALAAIRSSLA